LISGPQTRAHKTGKKQVLAWRSGKGREGNKPRRGQAAEGLGRCKRTPRTL